MKAPATALLALGILVAAPRRTEAGIVEGALIGAGVGAIVGVTMSLLRDSSSAPSKAGDSANAVHPSFAADSLVFRGGFGFAIVDDSLSSRKVQYACGKLFSGYDAYTQDRKTIPDTLTGSLVAKELAALGGVRRAAADAQYLVAYRQVLGWDMGEIVKRMTICVAPSPQADGALAPVCAEFTEETLFNTHPTRKSTVAKLVALLQGNKGIKKLKPAKYRRYAGSVEAVSALH